MRMNFLDKWQPQLLSVLRIVTALLFIEHGTAKFLHFPPTAMTQGISQLSFFGLLGLFEIVTGALVALGLFTRPIAFVLSGEMAVAYFMVHAPQSFFPLLNQGEGAIYFCFAFLYLAAAGPGPWSLSART
jgi:putative oxidoreductase